MNKRQHSQFNMLETVAQHFKNHEEIWSSNVLISETNASLTTKIAQIAEAARLQRHTSMGATIDKAVLRKDLEDKALFVSEAICAYTSLNPGQGQLYQTVYITQSKLTKMRESDLLYYVDCLHDAALEVITNLWPYGVTEATITDLVGAKNDFYELTKTTKEVIAARKEATADISALLLQAIAVLDKTMDKIVKIFRAANPHFVHIYFLDRRIQSLGTRQLSLTITTVDAATGKPVTGTKLTVVDRGISRISGTNGYNTVRNLVQGYYKLKVNHPEYPEQIIDFSVVTHKTTKLRVELESVLEEERRKRQEIAN